MKERIRLLLVEDDKVDRMAFERFIEREGLPYDCVTAGSVAAARKALADAQFDAALIDYLLGDGTAFDLFDEIEGFPIIVITGSGDEEIAVRAIKAGASDYLVKDPEGNYLKTLATTVEGAIHHRRTEEELRRYREHLEDLVEERTAELTKANEQLLSEIAERKRAESVLRQYAERMRTLRAIDGAILAAWSPEAIAQVALRHTRQLVPCLEASIVTFDLEAQEATLFAVHMDGEFGLEAGTHLPLGGLPEIEALRRGKVLLEKDIMALPSTGSGQSFQPPPAIQALQAAGVRSYVAAPLIAQGKLIGALALVADSPNAFTPDHMDIVREVADQVAVVLHQARLRTAVEVEQQRLEALVEHLPEGVLLLGGEQRILLSNPAARTVLPVLTDAAEGDVLTHLGGRPLEELLQPPSEGPWHELEVAGPPHRAFELVAQPMVEEAGGRGWVLLIRDVTEEQEVQQRVQQQDRLAAVGQLAAGIAHDFNNIMAVIVLYAEMLSRTEALSSRDRERLATINQQARHATHLIQQILDFSRRAVLERRPLDLVPFLKELVKMLERTLPESIKIGLAHGRGEYTVNADPTRVQQALMNLAVNARDAMPEGGELHIGLDRIQIQPSEPPPLPEMETGEWVQMTVSDTGMGIPSKVLPHIFEPFFTTKGPGQGSGLGLAQVYGIVSQHEGHIDVESRVGHGTTFTMYIPALPVSAPETLLQEMPAPAEGQGETILVVEDNPATRAALVDSLETLNYRVLEATEGQEALSTFEQRGDEIALVLSDLVMPKMGGKDLVRELRAANPHLKVLVITGYALPEDLQGLEAEGVLSIVQKPFDVNTLAETIRRILDAD